MYDLNKRAYITTLGELRLLLADYPNDTEISGAGAFGAWLHFDKGKDLVCIDPESLSESEEEYYTDDEEQKMKEQMRAHEARTQRFDNNQKKGGNANMRTWRLTCSVDADAIDYEEIIACDAEPDYWTCYAIAESHGCQFFDVNEVK